MMMSRALLLVSLLLLVVSCAQQQGELPTRGSVIMLTCESQATLMHLQAEEFTRLYPDAHVRMLTTSTRDAIVQLLNDSVTIACTDRALNAEERAVAKKAGIEFTEIRIAEDALALIVHPSNPATVLSVDQLRGVADGSLQSWDQIPGSAMRGPIRLAITGRNSGTYELLTRRILGLPGDARIQYLADSQRATLGFVAAYDRALGVVGTAALKDSVAPVRVLRIAWKDSTGRMDTTRLHQANIYQGLYPLHYPVFLYVRRPGRGPAYGFSTFVASAPGQKICLNMGLVPATMPVRLVQLTEDRTP
jgi:phosphate transport system substrate-binding protein